MTFVWLKPGTFTMGSPADEVAHVADEHQHEVVLTKGFWCGVYEVTQAEWELLMESNPSRFKGARLPVEVVSWREAVSYCTKLTDRERAAGRLPSGYAYRLLTESEWEYACRGGTTGPFHYGANLSSDQANFVGIYPYGDAAQGVFLRKTTPVGSYDANAWGLYDMHGNVLEWCSDWYGRYPTEGVADPGGPTSGKRRVYRGGSWNSSANYCRSASRGGFMPGLGFNYVGFRVALAPIR